MDKSWIDLPNRWSKPYLDGIDAFLAFAFIDKDELTRVYCPCRKCANRVLLVRKEMFRHLRDNGFLRKYKVWEKHGESSLGDNPLGVENGVGSDTVMENDMFGLIQDVLGVPDVRPLDDQNDSETLDEPWVRADEPTKNFMKLMERANLPLYPGCKKGSTAFLFTVKLLQAKVLHGWSDKSFQALLDILKEDMPEGTNLPRSYYEAQKLTEDLGFTKTTMDACPNSCMLFRNEHVELDNCLICKESRWKKTKQNEGNDVGPLKKKAAKKVRYFSVKQMLQRLYMCSKTAKLMRWHGEERTDDGVLRHPADSLAWKGFDTIDPTFGEGIRNVRLGLATDGFSPHRSRDIKHSCWPIILVPYNLPPMMLMKQPFIFMACLIDGSKAPGDKIDVYMEPVVEELKEVWIEGVLTYDAYKKEMFQLRAAILWTINDFPAYANLSGWSTKGKYACPCCNSEIDSCWLTHGRKHSYRGHRRWLPEDHEYREDEESFDGDADFRTKPPTLSGVDHLVQMEADGILTEYKIEDLQRKKKRARKGVKNHNWKKKSILFELPYWKFNMIRHNLDVMHVQKNVCDNVLWTILGDSRWSKDNFNSRRDLQEMGIRPNMWLFDTESGKEDAPPAEFVMSDDGKDLCLRVWSEISMPDGSASNISRRVNLQDRSIGTLKSHDMQLLLQQLIPLGVRNSLPSHVVQVLIDLGRFFKQLCCKTNTLQDLENARDSVVVTLCEMEKIFPPSFFDVMEHLIVHLADEAIVGGSVIFRWMFPIERYLGTLKEYARNNAYPEASMAKGYLMEQCMNFCTQYLNDVESKWNRPLRRINSDDKEGGKDIMLTEVTRSQIHRWILFHTEAVTPYLNEHLAAIRRQHPDSNENHVQSVHFDDFVAWFEKKVTTLQSSNDGFLSEEIITLSKHPKNKAKSFTSYTVNGFFFRIKSVDNYRATQNSGVVLQDAGADASSYYGRLTEIIKVTYSEEIKYVLFRCEWADPSVGFKVDKFNFPLVNFRRLLYRNDRLRDEPFILASQAHQVWYAPDPSGHDWLTVTPVLSKDFEHVQVDNAGEAQTTVHSMEE